MTTRALALLEIIKNVNQIKPFFIEEMATGRPQLKKTFSFGHCPNDGWGGLPMPDFFGPLFEVHFWSIKRVYFFKNAKVLNF